MRDVMLCVLFGLSLIAFPAMAQAANLCWVDHVKQTPKGLQVIFTDHNGLNVFVTHQGDKKESFYVENGVVRTYGADGALREIGEVVLQTGELAYVSQMPEDACTLLATDQNGQQGILASSAITLPGLPATRSSAFIPAQ